MTNQHRQTVHEFPATHRGAGSRRALIFLLLAAAVSFGPRALADGHTARTQFDTGIQSFVAEDYAAALVAFERSYELKAKAAVLLNIGMCQKTLFRFVEAIATFERYLELGDVTKAERRAEVQTEIVELQRLVGTLELLDVPAGAQVFVDELSVHEEQLTGPMLSNPGRHTIEVSAAGYETFRQEVVVEEGSAHTVAVNLEPLPVPSEIPPAVLTATHPLNPSNEPVDATARRRALSIGWSAIGIGSAAVCVGFGFHVKRVNDMATGNRAVEEFDQELYDEVRDVRLPTDNAGMIASYAVAGVFLTTGLIILLKNRPAKKHSKIAVTPTWGGARVTF